MTTGRNSWVSLDGLSDRQLAILREEANDWLVTKADDLRKGAEDADETKREVEEVAALGRLVSGLRRGQILMPDPIARELIARTIGETRRLDELREEYDREFGEHESWVALLAHFDAAPDTAAGDGGDAEPESLDDDEPVASAPEVGGTIELVGRLSDDQLRIARRAVTGALAGRAGDLRLLGRSPDPERAVGEVAALARLAFGIERRELEVPDRIARELMSRLAAEVDDMNEWEELAERYEQGIAEHDALVALAAIFTDHRPAGSSERSSEGSPQGGGDR
jgi:hypothetical protein